MSALTSALTITLLLAKERFGDENAFDVISYAIDEIGALERQRYMQISTCGSPCALNPGQERREAAP